MDLSARFLPLLACLALLGSAGRAAAAPPTLTSISDLTGGNEDAVTSVAFATLLAASDAADADGDTIQFRFKSLANGTLRKGAATVNANGTLGVGEIWSWTPPDDANGLIDAFRVRAFAGGEESATDILVRINVTAVNDAPSFTKGSNVTVAEDSGASSQSGWATGISAGPSDENGQTVQFVITSNTNAGLFSAGPAISANGTLTFTPAPNENGSASIGVKITDNGGTANGGQNESAVQTFTITVTPVPDAPVLGGIPDAGASAPLSDAPDGQTGQGTPQAIFSQLTVSDPDHNKPNADNQTVTVTVSKLSDLYGTFSLPNSSMTETGAERIYTLANLSPSLAQTRLRAATFRPTSNAVPVGVYSFDVKVELSDSTSRTAAPIDAGIHVESINDPPVVNAALSTTTIPDNAEASPFRLTVSDPDPADTFTVTIVETSPTPRGTLVPPTNPMTGTAEGVAAAMQNVRYQPTAQSSNQTATFQVSVRDVHPDGTTGDAVTGALSLTISFANDPPEFSGITTELLRTTDDPAAPPVYPFSSVTISDGDPGQSLTVTLSLDDPAKGGFIGDFNALGQLTGTAAEVTAKLREVAFRPATGRVPVNTSETVTLTITVNDGTAVRTNSLTQIEVTSVNGAPAVTWDVANGNVAGNFPPASHPALIDPSPQAKPFAKVGISDDGAVVVNVSLDTPAKGELQNLGGFMETPPGSRNYRFTGLPDDAETAIRNIVFVPNPAYIFPPGQPGRTDFTLSASDSALNVTTRILPVMLVSDARNFMVTSLLDDASLPGTLRHAVSVANNNDVITFALPTYPAVIRLGAANGPLVLDKHLSFRGPGADKLTISGDSNANGSTDAGDVQLFRIFAGVKMQGLRFARGFAETGGAMSVGRLQPDLAAGSLTLEDCVFAHCVATQWGGAIDVAEGSLKVSRCLFENNSLNPSSGLGGGAVSLYTNAACSFLNTTFSGNSQAASTGFGGGALYVENLTPNKLVQIQVTHCTFSGNTDAADKGSSLHCNVSNTRVLLANNIFGDFSARNLQVAGGGEILSDGGNLSNDNTTTTLIQGGVPQQAVLLNKSTDRRNTDPKLAPLGPLEGPSRGHRPLPDSPAIGAALADFAMVDQRGVVRNTTGDSGAVDADASGKIVIHEIFASQTSPDPQFIEFFNPRDQAALDLAGYEVWIDGLKRHVFASPQVVQPGFGVILADTLLTPASASTPVVLPSEPALTPELDLAPRGTIELRAPTTGGAKTVASVSYVAIFANSAVPSASLDHDLDSLTLAPQFQGAAHVPHGLVQPPPNGGVLPGADGAKTSPGADTGGTPFGEDNAYPIAIADSFEVTEDEVAVLDALANDLDADGSDLLFAVDLNPAPSVVPPASDKATILTNAGATVSISPSTAPLRGTAVVFDPRTAFNHLPAGARVTDTFAYSVIDVGGGAVAAYADGGAGTTLVSAPAHRLASGEAVTISGAGPAAYNGTRAVTVADEDSFRIPVAFAGNPGPLDRGRWQAVEIRSPSARSETLVQVSVLGRNDPPTPAADVVATDEDTILRIFGDPDFAGTGVPLDTDALHPAPRQYAAVGLLANDSDPDTNDQPFTQLRVVGVCRANPISGYAGTAGSAPVTVTAPAHGLQTGAVVLISGYGGHPSYNGYHPVTVTGTDTFTLPVTFVDDAAEKGLWTVLDDTNRFATTSAHGASVTLEIRADRKRTNVIYNPRPSAHLNGLAAGESDADTFHYAVEDGSGAVSLAPITVNVAGANDAPVPADNPPGLAALSPLVTGGATLPQVLSAAEILYVLPSASSPGAVDAALRPAGGGTDEVLVVAGIDRTHEDAPLVLASAALLANDGDVDRSDILRIEIGTGQNVSREGAAVGLSPDGSQLTYDPTAAPKLQALAFKERLIDTFTVTVTDGIARVDTMIAVLVEGRNDSPVAANAAFGTGEKTTLEVAPPGLLLSGTDIDQNTRLPDNRKILLPVEDEPTTVFGAKVDVLVERREGSIDGFAAGAAGSTVVLSPGHGLRSGEEVVLPASGAITGQYVTTRLDDDRFSVPVAFDSSFSSLGGTWLATASVFRYDPTASVFPGPSGGPAFTLQGLAQGQTYTDTFTYTLLDGSFLFANDDIFRIEADRTGIELPVLGNDTNLDGLASSRRIVAVGPASSGGTVSIQDDATLIYSPETGFVGDEVFTYTIEDDLGNRDTALVTARVTVDRLNGNLRAGDDRFTVAAGQAPLLDVLANDSIIPATGDPLALVAVSSAPDQGGQAVIENGRVRYTPSAAATVFPYTETFAYTMSGGGSAVAPATVSVLVVNRAGTLNVRADTFAVPAGSSGTTLNVLENDNILPGNGGDLGIVAVTTPVHGTVEILNGAGIAYTAPAGFLGNDTFSYTAADGFGGTGTAVVTVKVGYLTTNADIFSVAFDDPAKSVDDGFTALDVLANDNVLNGAGGGVAITAVTPTVVPLGQMSVAPDGLSLRFDPAPGATGQHDFTYTIADASGRAASGSVTVVVIAGGIRASSDFFTVQTDSQENELTVLSNDLRLSDLPGQLSVAAIGTGPNAPDQGGTVEISADFKRIIYTPAPGFRGTESFTYTVTDGDSTDTARVSVRSTIGEMVASDDEFLVFRGSTANRLAVLENDRILPDSGQLLFVTAIGSGSGSPQGTLEIVEDGAALAYSPPEGVTVYPFVETFTYEISSGGTRRGEATIRIEVLDRVGVRDLETNHDSFAVRSDSTGTLLPVLANDSVLPASAAEWIITGVTPPTANVCTSFLMADFLQPAAFAAELSAQSDSLTQFLWARFDAGTRTKLADPATSEAVLRATLVEAFNEVVRAGGPIHDPTRFAGVTLRERTQSLLDEGVGGELLMVLNRLLLEDAYPADIRQAPGGGAVQIVGNNLRYVPQPGFVGSERFTYRVSDGLGGTGSAEVIVRVGDVSVSDDRFSVIAGGGPVPLDVTANDGILRTSFPAPSLPAQADFTLTPVRPVTVAPVSAGTAAVDGDVVSFEPAAGFQGEAVLTYWVEDDGGCTYPGTAVIDVRTPGDDRDTAVVSVTVTGVNDPPQLLGVVPGAASDTSVARPFADATVVEFDEQRLQLVKLTVTYPPGRGVLGGGFTVVAPGVLEFRGTAAEVTAALRGLVFTPVENRIAVGTTEDTRFTVNLDDGFVATPVVVDTAVVTVTPVNDPPVITGTVSGQNLYQHSSLRPFVGVNVTDVDDLGLQHQQVTVTIDNRQKGFLSNLGGFVEQPADSGVYRFGGTPAAVAAAIRGLVFTPTPGGRITPQAPETAVFSIAVHDGFAAPVVDASTTVRILHGEVDVLLPLGGTGQDASQASAAFATSVAIGGDTLVVGSPLRDTPAVDAGRAFVYERNAGFGTPWGHVAEIAGSDSVAGDRFGQAVAIDGDFMAIGAPQADPGGVLNVGAVYVFQRNPSNPNAWTQVLKLTPPLVNGGGGDGFGSALALQGGTLLVGSPNSNRTGAPRAGRVHVYELGAGGPGDWALAQTLGAAELRSSGTGLEGEFFGAALAMDGDTAVIGSYGANRSGGGVGEFWDYGAAYVFTRTGQGSSWTEVKRLDEFTSPDGLNYTGFGYSVAVSGDRIAVGVHSGGGPSGIGTRLGGARLYERDSGGTGQWGLVRKFTPEGGANSVHFGHAVALSGELLMIGSPGPNAGSANNRGAVDVYRRSQGGTWSAIDRYIPGASNIADRFGHSLAFDSFTAVAGSIADNANATGAAGAGSARVYQFQYDLGPRLAVEVPDLLAGENETFHFAVDPATFGDPIYPGELSIGVQLTDGSPLPAGGWLSFDPLTGAFSGTPTPSENRSYELVLFAVNPLGSRAVSNVFRIDVDLDPARAIERAYGIWAETRFPAETLADPALAGSVWGMSANPDGDAYDNVLEMLFGTSPGQADPPQTVFRKLAGSQVSIEFPVSADFPPGAVHVEWSADLTSWSRAGVAMTSEPMAGGGSRVTAVVTPPTPQAKVFVRVVAGP